MLFADHINIFDDFSNNESTTSFDIKGYRDTEKIIIPKIMFAYQFVDFICNLM